MEIKLLNIEEIKPYEKNPRKNDEAVQYVERSIREFGFKVPIIIDKDNVIVAGHTRYKAAKNLNIKKVPCVIADDLSEEQVKAFRLADNKVSEMAGWDFELLDEELSNLLDFDMESFGFAELEDVDINDFFVEAEEQKEKEKEIKKVQCPHCKEWIEI